LSADLHEFQLTPEGTALITFATPVVYDARTVKGPKHALVFDTGVQEIDIKTGLVLFEWHSVGSLLIRDSVLRFDRGSDRPYDPFHINSIDQEPNGNLLVSSRHTNALYEFRHLDGLLQW